MSEEMTAKDVKEAMLASGKTIEESLTAKQFKEPKAVEEAPKPPEKGFNELGLGKHVRLACACEGFVSQVQMTENEEDRWFALVFTTGGCGKKNYGHFYGEGFPLQKSVFRADVFPRTFPFKETPAPEWFLSLEAGPVNANDRRYIAVSVKGASGPTSGATGMNFVIPGRGLKPNVYAVATELREKFDPEHIVVEVFECVSLEKAIETAKDRQEFSSPIEERNSEALADWIVAMLLQLPPTCSISPHGKSPLLPETITAILNRVKAHPAYRGHTVGVISSDGKTVTLTNGEIR